MNKKVFKWHGKFYYLLGRDANGEMYYLEQATYNCGWYWGIGYIETFTNTRCPAQSKDITSHQHFDTLFFKPSKCAYDNFMDFFVETPFTKEEIWEILELMRCLYTARKYSDMLHIHGSNLTTNDDKVKKVLTCGAESNRINNTVIPTICDRLIDILEN